MKRILLFVLLIVILVSCSLNKTQISNNEVILKTMMVTCNIENATINQVDSIIAVDSLPNLNKWLNSTYKDYETNEKITKRLYIRQKENKEIVYIITGIKEPYKITKRVTE